MGPGLWLSLILPVSLVVDGLSRAATENVYTLLVKGDKNQQKVSNVTSGIGHTVDLPKLQRLTYLVSFT